MQSFVGPGAVFPVQFAFNPIENNIYYPPITTEVENEVVYEVENEVVYEVENEVVYEVENKVENEVNIEVTMDYNQLIDEVHSRPSLWDQQHASYNDRRIANRLWDELSLLFKIPKEDLKLKWKSLRDRYRVELKRELYYERSKCERDQPVWVRFESLEFLRDQMNTQTTAWDLKKFSNKKKPGQKIKRKHARPTLPKIFGDKKNESTPQQSQNSSKAGISSTIIKDQSDESMVSPATENENSETMIRTISSEELSQSINDFDKESSQADTNDSYHFLMSLLPHMKKLSGERRMLLSSKIQQLVYEEVYKN